MKNFIIMSLVLFGVISCGVSSSSNRNVSGGSVSPATGLGDQIDRMGRPAVNTALNNTFTADGIRGAAEDSYNRTNTSDGSSFTSVIGAHFAIYDSLVNEIAEPMTGCGDNGLTNRASANPSDGLATGDDRYSFLATVFSDDQLYINASTSIGSQFGECKQYLAVELWVIGAADLGNDCGGRAPNYDVIETTFSAVAAGSATGVDDGVTADARTHSDAFFPFLAQPN